MVDPEERSTSLSTKVQGQVSKFLELTDLPQLPEPIGRSDSVQRDGQDEDRKLRRRVAAKFAEGNVAGAVREISSLESIAPNCRETLELLKRKHPPAPADRHLPDPPDASLVGACGHGEGGS